MTAGKDKKKGKLVKPGSALLRWGLSCLLIIWAFILGLLVGQGSLGSDQQLESLRRLSLSWFGISFYREDEQNSQAPLRDPDLSFYRDLSSHPTGRGPVPPSAPAAPPAPRPEPAQPAAATPAPAPNPQISEHPSQAPAPGSAAAPAPSAQHAAQAGATVEPSATPPPALNQIRPYRPDAPIAAPSGPRPAATTGPAPSPQPSSTQPTAPRAAPAPTGRFTVQVGSFKDEYQATDLSNRLRRAGFPAYVSRISIEGVGVRLRVRVGGYDNLDSAQNVATSLRMKENIAAYVTRND